MKSEEVRGKRKMQIYVDGNAVRSGNGQKEYPFQTISEAAKIARPGDEVLVAPGVYREYVDPANAGCEDARIVYRSVEPGKAVITGAEIVDNWEHLEGDVWTARVSNGLFGDYNPYTTLVSGDWFIASYTAHTGEVYLNGKSMYEVTSLDKVKKPEIYKKSWDQAFTVYTWYVEQDEEKNETVFYVNFQGKNPNEETVEINVRENCFYPSKEGIGYITLAGFVVKQAATQWLRRRHIRKEWSVRTGQRDGSSRIVKFQIRSAQAFPLENTDSRTMIINGSNGNSKMAHRRSVTVSARRSGRDGQRKTSEATSSAGATSMTVDRRVL